MQSKSARSSNVFRIAVLGIMSGIIIVQNFVIFLGYIPLPFMSATIIHITVIIGAIVFSPFEGAVLGGVWGLICLIRAFAWPVNPTDPIFFTNPVISVFPRVMVGIVAGYLYRALSKIKFPSIASMAICGIVGSLTNTILVLGTIYLFKKEAYADANGMAVAQVLPFLLGVVAANGIPEAIVSGVITPVISKALLMVKGAKRW